jgi:hypothetical protein
MKRSILSSHLSNQQEEEQLQEILRCNLAGQKDEKLAHCLQTDSNSSLVLIASVNDHNTSKSSSSNSSLNPVSSFSKSFSPSILVHSPPGVAQAAGIQKWSW